MRCGERIVGSIASWRVYVDMKVRRFSSHRKRDVSDEKLVTV